MYSKDRVEGINDRHYTLRTSKGLIVFTQRGLIKTAVTNNMLAGDGMEEISDKVQKIIDDFNQVE